MSKYSKVQLVVSKFGKDPDVVTTLLGLKPTGVTICGWTSLPPMSEWVFEISNSPDKPLDAALVELLEFLLPYKERLTIAGSRYQTCIRLAIDDRDFFWPNDKDASVRTGRIDMPPIVIEKLGQLGIGLSMEAVSGLEAHSERSD